MRTPIVQRLLVPMGLTALLGSGWLGCSGDAPRETSRGSEGLVATRALDRPALATPSLADRRTPWTPANDLEMLDYLVVHHRQTIRMVDAELARGARTDLRALASVMRDVRTAQLDVLMATRNALVGSVDVTDVPWDPHMDQALKAMGSLSGGALDRMFLVEMIGHDAAAIGPSLRAQSTLLRPEMQKLAQDLYDGLTVEVSEMGMMLGDDSLASVHGAAEAGLGPFGDPRVPFTPANDVQLVDYLVSRHLDALAMTDLVLTGGADPDVHAFAASLKTRLEKDLEMMRRARFALTGSVTTPEKIPDAHVDAIVEAMRKLVGAPLDRMYLDEMRPHEADDLAPAQRTLNQLVRPDLRFVLVQTLEIQAQDLGRIQSMQSKL